MFLEGQVQGSEAKVPDGLVNSLRQVSEGFSYLPKSSVNIYFRSFEIQVPP
jgi:hypothetical protein